MIIYLDNGLLDRVMKGQINNLKQAWGWLNAANNIFDAFV